MRSRHLFVWPLAAVLVLFFVFDAIGAKQSRIKVSKSVSESLLSILQGSNALHSQMFNRDEKGMKEQLKKLLSNVDSAIFVTQRSEDQENRLHLEKLLSITKVRLRDILNVMGSDPVGRMHFLREYFQQVVQLARLYEVPHALNVFFCPRDKARSVWLQKASKAQNPFDPDGSLKNCGAIMK